MRIGAQLYTVREYTQTQKDFADTIKKISQIGYDLVQASAVGAVIPPSEIAETCKAYNIKVTLTHTNPDRILKDTERVIDEHHLMGAKYVGIGSLPAGYSKDKDGYRRFITDYIPVARALKESGLQLLYHNHAFEFEKIDGVLALDYMYDKFADLNFTLDTYWIQAGGADPAYWIKKYGERVDVLHLKDYAIVNGEPRNAEVKEGNLNWDAIMEAASAAGVEYGMVEQDDCYGRDPFESLRISFNNLRG